MKENDLRKIVYYLETNFPSGPDRENGSCVSTRFLYLCRRYKIVNTRLFVKHYSRSPEGRLSVRYTLDEYNKVIVPEWRNRRLKRNILHYIIRVFVMIGIIFFCLWFDDTLITLIVFLFGLAYVFEMAISLPLCLADEYVREKITRHVFI